jgi:hypothetical protein
MTTGAAAAPRGEGPGPACGWCGAAVRPEPDTRAWRGAAGTGRVRGCAAERERSQGAAGCAVAGRASPRSPQSSSSGPLPPPPPPAAPHLHHVPLVLHVAVGVGQRHGHEGHGAAGTGWVVRRGLGGGRQGADTRAPHPYSASSCPSFALARPLKHHGPMRTLCAGPPLPAPPLRPASWRSPGGHEQRHEDEEQVQAAGVEVARKPLAAHDGGAALLGGGGVGRGERERESRTRGDGEAREDVPKGPTAGRRGRARARGRGRGAAQPPARPALDPSPPRPLAPLSRLPSLRRPTCTAHTMMPLTYEPMAVDASCSAIEQLRMTSGACRGRDGRVRVRLGEAQGEPVWPVGLGGSERVRPLPPRAHAGPLRTPAAPVAPLARPPSKPPGPRPSPDRRRTPAGRWRPAPRTRR